MTTGAARRDPGETVPASGLLVTFEGPEGSGKSTLIATLADRLRGIGAEPVLVREPGGTPIGERIRDVLLDPDSGAMFPETELLLMVASRAQLVRETVRPALAGGRVVLCDRFADASVAYQGFGRGLGKEMVDRLNAVALDGVVPDLTFLCLLPPAEGLARLKHRATDRLDREAMAFHERVYAGYREMADSGEKRFKVIDARGEPGAMAAAALEHLKRLEHGLLKDL